MRSCAVVLLLFAIAGPASLKAGTVTFEGFPDSTSLTNQYLGLSFTHATVLTAGISLNEFEFPPYSGSNVAFDDGGPISIIFDTPVLSFGGYFTYIGPLSIAGFDDTSNLVAWVSSAYFSNLALSGDPGSSPNEFLQVSLSTGISSVTITGDPFGGSFVLDDATVVSAVPEPASLTLLLTAAAGIMLLRRRTP